MRLGGLARQSCAARRSGGRANRYRNPDDDLPADFEAQRIPYYQALKLPLEADRFIANLQAEMREALRILDAGMPRNLASKSAGSGIRRPGSR